MCITHDVASVGCMGVPGVKPIGIAPAKLMKSHTKEAK